MNRKRRLWVRAGAVALGTGLALACSDIEEAPNGPGDIPTDTEMGMVEVAMDSVRGDYFVANAEAFESLEALGPLFGSGFNVAPLVAAPPLANSGPKGMQSIMRLVQRSPRSIPPDAVGTTYGYNSSTGDYEALERSGAPTNGVRFLLYEISGSSPVMPLNEIGYVDVAMTSPPPSVNLTIDMVIDGVTVLHLSPSGTVTLDQASINMPGYVSEPDGGSQVSFNGGWVTYGTYTVVGYSLYAMSNAFLSYNSASDSSLGTEEMGTTT